VRQGLGRPEHLRGRLVVHELHGLAARTVGQACQAARFEGALRAGVGLEPELFAADDGDEQPVAIQAVAAEHAPHADGAEAGHLPGDEVGVGGAGVHGNTGGWDAAVPL
jgi:hypothetical protein